MEEEILSFAVGPEGVGQRLDVWLLGGLVETGDYSRARVQQLIKEGYVRRGADEERNPARKVRAGEVYEVDVPEVGEFEVVGEDIPLEILYEDADLIVLNKPAGLTVHPAPGNWTGTLVHALVHHCGAELSGINGVARPGIVHRLDKDTSGVMMVAKHDAAHRGLAKQLASHSLHRVYEALVRGVPMPPKGVIEGNIGRHPVDRIKRAVVAEPATPNGSGEPRAGKHAVTHYEMLEAYGKSAARVQLQLETGRTHQIRVHMAHKGHPLLGDPLYGNFAPLPHVSAESKGVAEELVKGLKRQMLHARELGFTHPISGKEMLFESEVPADMQTLIQSLRSIS